MKKPNWKAAGAAGLAAGLTVGGFSLVSASSLERAVQTVESREAQAAPAAGSMVLTMARATMAPERSFDPASPDRPRVVTPPVVHEEPSVTPKATPHATPKAVANHVHSDDCSDCSDCADCADCANGVHCADSATSVASVASDASVASVDSDH